MKKNMYEYKVRKITQCDFCTKEADSKCDVCGKDYCYSHGSMLTYNCSPMGNPFSFTNLPCICRGVCIDCIKKVVEQLKKE